MNDDQIKSLLDQRSGYFKIKADVTSIFEPRIFELTKENASNVRNTIIVAATLATIDLITFNSSVRQSQTLWLIISAAAFLLCIIGYSFYLKYLVGNSITENQIVLARNILMADKGQEIIESALDNKITFDQALTKLANHYKDIEENVLRKKNQTKLSKYNKEYVLAQSSNWLFVGGIVAMIVAFVSYLICV